MPFNSAPGVFLTVILLGSQLKLAGTEGPQGFQTRQDLDLLWLNFPLRSPLVLTIHMYVEPSTYGKDQTYPYPTFQH